MGVLLDIKIEILKKKKKKKPHYHWIIIDNRTS